jgi:hypothetical protein
LLKGFNLFYIIKIISIPEFPVNFNPFKASLNLEKFIEIVIKFLKLGNLFLNFKLELPLAWQGCVAPGRGILLGLGLLFPVG